MAGLLAENGYRIVNDEMEADVWLLNSCTVKNPAEGKLLISFSSVKLIVLKITSKTS